MLEPWLVYFLIGCAVGLVSTYLGAGGGILIMPLLPLFVDWSYREILATCQVTVFFVVVRNLVTFHRHKMVPWQIVFMTGPTSALSGFIAGLLTGQLNEKYLVLIFILVLGLLSLNTWFIQPEKPIVVQRGEWWRKASLLMLGALGGGFLAGFTGVGAGMVMIPLVMTSGLVLNSQIAPTSNGTLAFCTFFAVMPLLFENTNWSFLKWGLVHADASIVILFGAWLTSIFGHRFQAQLSPIWRKRLVAGLLSGLTLQVVYHEWTLIQQFLMQ